MTKGFMLVAAVAGAVLGAERADACATVTFTQSSVVGWDPLRGTNGIAQLTATVQRVSPNTRAARLIFSDSHGTNQIGPSGAGAGPDYVIRDVNGTIVSFPVNTLVSQRSEVVNNVAWESGSSANAQATFNLSILPSASAGRDYIANQVLEETLNYSIACFQGNGNANGSNSASSSSQLRLTVPELLSINTASSQTLNFRDFTSAQQELTISLKSTGNIRVEVSASDNSQLVLANAPTPFAANSVIPYTMTLNGRPIANNSPLTGDTRAGVSGASWPFVLNLTGGLPSGKIAGNYSGTITLTLTAN